MGARLQTFPERDAQGVKTGRVRYRVRGGNGEPMATSTEGYRDNTDADRGIVDLVLAVREATAATSGDAPTLTAESIAASIERVEE